MDHVSKEARSKIMASIRSRGNGTTEIALGKLLRVAGFLGYRKHWPVSGKPDFAWPGRKIAVFVDGCFWHGCTKCKYLPRTNSAFWEAKFTANKKRDRRVSLTLRREGWIVIRIKECDISKPKTLQAIAQAIEITSGLRQLTTQQTVTVPKSLKGSKLGGEVKDVTVRSRS